MFALVLYKTVSSSGKKINRMRSGVYVGRVGAGHNKLQTHQFLNCGGPQISTTMTTFEI